MGKANRYYTDDFKRQIEELEANGKKISELEREYKVTKTTIREWKKRYGKSGEFGAEANRSESEKEIRDLRKEVRQLRMENDIMLNLLKNQQLWHYICLLLDLCGRKINKLFEKSRNL